jgi:hypothetical protein
MTIEEFDSQMMKLTDDMIANVRAIRQSYEVDGNRLVLEAETAKLPEYLVLAVIAEVEKKLLVTKSG